ncbi:glycosyltransferase [Desulfococcaceae bacterium HSG9]|nr:glycosyltransferase [Desulfococcaceae bacterium HSG9]
MKILFIHPNFPAQFRFLAAALGANPDNHVIYATKNPRPEWHINGVTKAVFTIDDKTVHDNSLSQALKTPLAMGEAVLNLCRELKKNGFEPDVVYGHSGWGSAWFVKDVFPKACHLSYLEWYYNSDGADMVFGRWKPMTSERAAGLRLKNTPILSDLTVCDLGIAPTKWQRDQFPELFHPKIVQLFDGVDTDVFRPNPDAKLMLPDLDLTDVPRIITYASRGMEPYRGFPQFMEALPYILAADTECHVVIVASERVCYGPPPASGQSYKKLMLEKIRLSQSDRGRVHFVGTLPYGQYRQVLQASDVHIYLTRPFVLSWSLIEALACGCLVVASDTEPVREVIQNGTNGFLVDFFAPQAIAERVLGILNYPSFMTQIKANARKTILERYALKKVLPKHLEIIDRNVIRET